MPEYERVVGLQEFVHVLNSGRILPTWEMSRLDRLLLYMLCVVTSLEFCVSILNCASLLEEGRVVCSKGLILPRLKFGLVLSSWEETSEPLECPFSIRVSLFT